MKKVIILLIFAIPYLTVAVEQSKMIINENMNSTIIYVNPEFINVKVGRNYAYIPSRGIQIILTRNDRKTFKNITYYVPIATGNNIFPIGVSEEELNNIADMITKKIDESKKNLGILIIERGTNPLKTVTPENYLKECEDLIMTEEEYFKKLRTDIESKISMIKKEFDSLK